MKKLDHSLSLLHDVLHLMLKFVTMSSEAEFSHILVFCSDPPESVFLFRYDSIVYPKNTATRGGSGS